MIYEERGISAEALNLHIARATADILSLPKFCRTAHCRRSHRCRGAAVDGNWPHCMGILMGSRKPDIQAQEDRMDQEDRNVSQAIVWPPEFLAAEEVPAPQAVHGQQRVDLMQNENVLYLVDHLQDVMLDIREGIRPSQPPEEPALAVVEALAIRILSRCLPQMPRFAPHFRDWLRRRAMPALSSGQALEQCRAEMRKMGLG